MPLHLAVAFLFVSLPSHARADAVRESRDSAILCDVNVRFIQVDQEASCWSDASDVREATAGTAAAGVAVAGAAADVVELPSPRCLMPVDEDDAGCSREKYAAVEEGAEAAVALAALGGSLATCGESLGLMCFAVPWAARQYYKEADDAFRATAALQVCLSKP